MKNFAFLICFSFAAQCFGGDAEEIRDILQKNFEACNREDADAMLATCSVDMPDRKGFREESVRLWRDKDIHYSLVDFEIVKIQGEYATARITQKTHSTDRNHENEEERFYRNGTTLLPDDETVVYMAAFKKDFGVWKCYLTISQPVPVK